MLKKLKQIWHEIIERWFLLTFFAERMERERLQVLAELVKRKDTLWKNTPLKPRTIKEILENKEPKKKPYSGPVIQDALHEALKNIQQKENGEQQEKK